MFDFIRIFNKRYYPMLRYAREQRKNIARMMKEQNRLLNWMIRNYQIVKPGHYGILTGTPKDLLHEMILLSVDLKYIDGVIEFHKKAMDSLRGPPVEIGDDFDLEKFKKETEEKKDEESK